MDNQVELERPWRNQVGGMWQEIGTLQYHYLLKQGLQPRHKFLDVGCGCLRAGVHFINYLENGNYYGIDSNWELLNHGLNDELPHAGIFDKQAQLLHRSDFNCRAFGVLFDFGIAQSVFTHLPSRLILQCLQEVQMVLSTNGKFFATFFEQPNTQDSMPIIHQPGGIKTYTDRDPYHYAFSAFEKMARQTGLKVTYLGDWKHPRAQKIMLFQHLNTNT